MPRRSRFARISPSQKRKFAWEGLIFQGTFPNLANNAIGATWLRTPAGAVDTFGVPEVVIPPDDTLTRLRAIVTFGTNNGGAQVSNTPYQICFGIIDWEGLTDDPTDIGLLPNPSTDQGLNWVWRAVFPSVIQNIALADNASTLDAYQSLAQRKLDTGTGLLFVFSINDLSGVITDLDLYLSFTARWLIRQA